MTKSPTDRDNGQMERRHIQSTLLYSLDHQQTKDMRPDNISSSVQYIQKQLDKEKGWTMDPLVQPSIESLVPTNLCSAGPVYAFAFACNAKIITTATYFPFGNLALGRTSEHVYMQRSSKVRARLPASVALRRATPTPVSKGKLVVSRCVMPIEKLR